MAEPGLIPSTGTAAAPLFAINQSVITAPSDSKSPFSNTLMPSAVKAAVSGMGGTAFGADEFLTQQGIDEAVAE